MKRKRWINLSSILLPIVLILFSCTIETAQPPLKKKLVVVSDYLYPTDTTLFASFINKQNVSISIQNLSTDKIIGHVRNFGNNSGFDIVILRSMYDAYKLNKRDILHDIKVNKEENKYLYSSSFHNFYGFGIDPYIILNSDSNRYRLTTYNDLTNHSFINLLDERELTPFLSPVKEKMKRVQANNWIKKFLGHAYSPKNLSDSLHLVAPILTTAAKWDSLQKVAFYKNRKAYYPNKKSTGSFFNIRTIGIIKQAENYVLAQKFISHFLTEVNNFHINKSLGTFSIFEKNGTFRKYGTRFEKLMEHYIVTDRTVLRFQ